MARDETETTADAPATAQRLSWALCVATLNRIDALTLCVRHALDQTRPPAEIVIVDASDAWETHREKVAALSAPHDVPLRYLRADRRSLTSQRNQGARAATADILFMIDDDSFMHRDCAARIMAVYEADTAGAIGAISCAESRATPETPETPETPAMSAVEQKDNSSLRSTRVKSLLRTSRLARFLWREVLLMSADRLFIPYDGDRPVSRPELVERIGITTCVPVRHISGFALTARRELVLKEPFEDALLSYCPTEDTEATYRFSRHAANALVRDAFVYHHQAASGRIKRRQAIELTMANLAFFIRKRSSDPRRDVFRYYVLALRRVVAEALKDGLSLRLSLPQLRGTMAGTARSFAIFRANRATLDDWYQSLQQDILAKKPRSAKG